MWDQIVTKGGVYNNKLWSHQNFKIQILTLKPFSFSNLLSIWCSKKNNLALFQRICLSFCLAISSNIHSKRNFCELMMLRYSLHIMKNTEVPTKWQSVFYALIWRKYLICKLSPFQPVKKKPVGHSIGMIWNATGSFFLIKEYTHLKNELKTNKRAEMLFSLEDVYIAANLAHSSDTSIYTANK